MSRMQRHAITALALVCALAPLPTLCGCGGSGSTSEEAPTQETEAEATSEDEAYAGGLADDGRGEDEVGIANAGNTTEGATLDDWSNKARSFLNIYPVNHMRAGGASDEPVQMQLSDWANNCLRYVDPASSLGKALQDDPESVAAPLGFYEAASVVNATEVTGASTGGVNVTVTIEGTQQDWQHTSTFTQSYLVQFNNDGLITGVVSTD